MGREYNPSDPDRSSWGGFSGRAPDADNPYGLASGAQQDTNRYRGLGQAAANRQAYQQNFDAANSDRNNAAYARLNQQDAVRLQQEAAYGNAPSAAQMLQRNTLDQSLQAQMAGAASARGGSLAQAAALRGGAMQAQQMQQQGMNQIGAMRAQEQAQARDAYMGAASQLRGQDYQSQSLAQQQAGMQQQSELYQRGLNQQAQQGYEQMGWNTQNAQLNSEVAKYNVDQNSLNQQKERNYQHDEKWTDRLWNLGGSVIGGIGGLFSDENAKVPIGALGAPAGYAASRAGQDGYMFGSETAPDGSQMAPGTQDYMKAMGGGPSLNGTGAKPAQASPGLSALLMSMGRGMTMSDEDSKVPVLGGAAPMSPSTYATKGGGIDVMGTFRQQNAAIDAGRRNPTGAVMTGPAAGGMMSDEKSKMPTGVMGYEDGARIGADGLGYVERPEAESVVPGKFAAMQKAKEGGSGLAKAAMAQHSSHKMSDEELRRWADAELGRVKREHAIRMEAGPAVRRAGEGTPENGYTTQLTEGGEKAFQRWREKNSPWDTGQDYDLRGAFADGLERDGRLHLPDTYKKPNHETFSVESKYAEHAPDEAGSWDGERYIPKGPPAWLRQEVRGSQMADAARAMASVPYAYKPGLQPPEQAPGEPNVGPIAQNMAANPVTATAVKRDPATGLLMLDQGKMTKVLGGVVSNQQREIDQLKASLAAVAARGTR